MRHIVFFTFFMFQFITAQETYKEVFVEEFNYNINGWQIEDTQLRKSQIKNGKLIDWYGETDYATTNLITVSFDKSMKYIISVSLANLNNKRGSKYPTYKIKPNGKIKKSWEKYPEWGFVWGFKDWNNYNAIILQKKMDMDDGLYRIYYKVFTVEKGMERVHIDWSRNMYNTFLGETNYYEFILVQRDKRFSIFVNKPMRSKGKKLAEITPLYDVNDYKTKWFGNYIGPFIGAGANVSVDFIKIGHIIPTKKEVENQP